MPKLLLRVSGSEYKSLAAVVDLTPELVTLIRKRFESVKRLKQENLAYVEWWDSHVNVFENPGFLEEALSEEEQKLYEDNFQAVLPEGFVINDDVEYYRVDTCRMRISDYGEVAWAFYPHYADNCQELATEEIDQAWLKELVG